MATKKKYPEFELPALIVGTFTEYLGPRKMAKLSANQRKQIAKCAQDTADIFSHILEHDAVLRD